MTATHHTVAPPYSPDPILVDTLGRLLAKTCTHGEVQGAEERGWSAGTWDALASVGAPWIGVPESSGGSGGTPVDVAAVLRACGAWAAPVPIAETGVLGGWLAGAAGLELPDGAVTVVPGRSSDTLVLDDDRLSGTAHGVPWAAAATLVLALVDGRIVAFRPDIEHITRRANLAGEPRDTLELTDLRVTAVDAPSEVDAQVLRLRGAFARSCQMTGAMERITEITVAYTNERRQFGRPVSTFQAVGQHLVRAASETQLAAMAMHTAIAAIEDRGFGGAEVEIACFKAIAGEAADVVSSRCHQAHGAIGMTQEYVLHQLTRRLWSWRDEHGSTTWWRQRLGQLTREHCAIDPAHPDRLWQLVTRGGGAS
ncbi:MAG: acyl-CoA dehydrogenase family protein [Ilumatobacteraceae bacterium]